MSPDPPTRPERRQRFSDERGSLLIVAMLVATAVAIGLAGYLNLGRTSLKLAHRTFFAHDALNLAEVGIEEAVYCFNLMGSGTSVATAWTGWTLSGTNAMRTLTPFNRDQNAVGTVKVYVRGHNGSNLTPYIVAQATIVPFDDSAPIVKALKVTLKKSFPYGVVARNSMTWNNQVYADSFNSNPTNSPTGPWLAYPALGAVSNTTVVVAAGSVSLAAAARVRGNLFLGASVTAPPANRVTGTIQSNFTKTFSLPTYPAAASLNQSYSLGSTIPATLPVAGHVAASDGRFYYFCSGAIIGATTITAGRNVTIVGTGTRMVAGLTVGASATCIVYMDGTVTLSGSTTINNSNWAGALQIFSSSSGNFTFSNQSQIRACVFAPSGRLTASNTSVLTGSFVFNTITCSNNAIFHYDEAVQTVGSGNAWAVTSWFELQSSADRGTLGTLTNNFLP